MTATENLNDEALLKLINQRNPDAVGVLYERQHTRMALVVVKTTRCTMDEAEDAVQEAFTKWLGSKFQATEIPIGLLITYAVRDRISIYRKDSRFNFEYIDEPVRGSDGIRFKELPAPKPEPTEDRMQIDRLPEMLEKMKTLPWAQSELLNMRYTLNMTYDAIGERLGVNQSTAQRKVKRAERALKVSLGLCQPLPGSGRPKQVAPVAVAKPAMVIVHNPLRQPVQLSFPQIQVPVRLAIVPIAEVERAAIMDAIHKAYGNVQAAADALGVSSGKMYKRLDAYGYWGTPKPCQSVAPASHASHAHVTP